MNVHQIVENGRHLEKLIEEQADKIKDLEKRISEVKDLEIKHFCRPGVNQISAFLHLARAITRRAERKVVGLKNDSYQPLVNYLNRLSSLLFWLAVRKEKK